MEDIELEILNLARNCHEGWMQAKLANGYMYGPETDDVAKTNCNLVPWEELDEEIKQNNINSARKSYELVNRAGFRFVEAASIVPAFKKVAAKAIAKELHLAWARDKLSSGWTYAETTDKSAKKHRDLCVITGVLTYDEFLEKYPEDAAYDFDTAYSILNGDAVNCPVPESVYAMLMGA